MPHALAFDLRSLERDETPAASLRISCANCDPDNPRAVPRSKCRRCGGTGRTTTHLARVVEEIRASREEPRHEDEEDLGD